MSSIGERAGCVYDKLAKDKVICAWYAQKRHNRTPISGPIL